MRLKQIEIQGFKSFAEKTVIHLDNDVTGIVGPNGCGKSNVVDAIRWVLGEQKSKALRSEKMDNLIFNGTTDKAASQRAHVSLTLENSKNLMRTDFNTVTITREIYRDGESVYKVNDVACRLKDIQELFTGTGLSTDSYSIIELPMIGNILNDKDIRRNLIEQAAGISSYKQKKRETLNKLVTTEGDLTRLLDLMAEIENNLKSTEQQAKRAEKYLKLKEQYKELATKLTIYQLQEHKSVFEDLSKQEETEKNHKAEIEGVIARYETESTQIKNDLLEREQALIESQKKLDAHLEIWRKEEANKQIKSEKVKFLNDKVLTLNTRIAEEELAIKELTENIAQLEAKIEDEQEKLKLLSSTVESQNQSSEEKRKINHNRRQELSNQEQQVRLVENKLTEEDRRLAIINTEKNTLQNEDAMNKQNNLKRQEDLQILTQELEKITGVRQKENEEYQALIAKEEKLVAELEEVKTKTENHREKIQETTRELDARRNEYNLTKSLVENLEGFPESVQFLQKNKEWSNKPRLLSDLISCEEEYKPAIENYLEGYMNWYVVENNGEAFAAIELLSKNKKGKAGFISLKELSAHIPTHANLAQELLPVHTLLQTDEIYKPLMDHLFHNVFLAPEDQIDSLSKDHPNSIFISQNGKLIKNREKISGGSVGSFAGKRLGKVKNLERLEKVVAELQTKADGLREEMKTLHHSQERLQAERKTIMPGVKKDQLNRLENQAVSIQTKIENFQLFLQDSATRQAVLQEKFLKLDQDKEAIISSRKKIEEERESQLQVLAKVKQIQQESEQEMQEAVKQFNDMNIQFHQQQNKLNGYIQEREFKRNRVRELETAVNRNKQLLVESDQEQKQLHHDLLQNENEVEFLQRQKEELTAEVSEKEQLYYGLRGSIEEFDNKIKQALKNKENVDQLLTALKDKYNQLQYNLVSLKERLSIEFHLDINELLQQEMDGEIDKEDMEQKVGKMKKTLENFGEVNPFAVDAYKEVKERYDFLIAQKDDLENAKLSLQQTIAEVEKAATEKFLVSFNQVRENFQIVFKQLFTEGDTCDLILTEPDNPLESKVEIMARPKGKRPLTIDALSGGEKSLTAISLIFGLYLIKPAPFCVLDEVDAPLDDENVDKFNKMVQTFSANSQFIVVTHNKKTMSYVKRIYGIVMAKTGISRAVAVDFASLN